MALQDLPHRAVNGDEIAFFQRHTTGNHGLAGVINAQATRARHTGLAHAARHHSRMRGHAATGCQNTFCRMHAVNIFR